MFRDLVRPKALFSHLLVLVVAGALVGLGLWQLDRLGQVRDNNALLAERLAAPPLELADLVADSGVDEEALEFRSVTASGVFRPDEEVLQRNREHQGQQGFHLLTPLELDGGGVVLVRRGWVPASMSEPPVEQAAPPEGTVEVSGLLERPVTQPGFGARDPDDGVLARVFHTDTQRLNLQVEGELYPMVLRLQEQEPPLNAGPGELPEAIPAPELDEANHLSYALQWFSFAALALITYGAWLWTRHRRGGGDANGASDTEPEDAPEPATKV
jgi:surfeit locus 1 family protein